MASRDQNNEPDDYAAALGARLKEARKRKLLTITQLSKYTGMSVGYLSNVERGLTSPTVSSLRSICRELGVQMADILSVAASRRDVIRSDEARLELRSEFGMAMRTFDFGMGSDVVEVIRLEPGCAKTDAPALHPYPETVYVTEGELTLTVDGDPVRLAAGDAACVKANHPHTTRNDGEEMSESVWFRLRHSSVTNLL